MWANNLKNAILPLTNIEVNFGHQIRNTFILKRRWPPGLHKVNSKPKPLRGRHYVYDLVKDTNIEKQQDLNVVLTSYVAGFGKAGDQISVKPTVAYNKLLLPGYAVYATPENIKKHVRETTDEDQHSSPYAQRTVNVISSKLLSILMNKHVPWTLEPWHVRASFRKAGFHVAEDAITMPSKPISGPDLSLEDKYFYVTVTVNNCEKAKVKCKIHHWSTDVTERLPYVPEFWKSTLEPLFPEDESESRTETKSLE